MCLRIYPATGVQGDIRDRHLGLYPWSRVGGYARTRSATADARTSSAANKECYGGRIMDTLADGALGHNLPQTRDMCKTLPVNNRISVLHDTVSLEKFQMTFSSLSLSLCITPHITSRIFL